MAWKKFFFLWWLNSFCFEISRYLIRTKYSFFWLEYTCKCYFLVLTKTCWVRSNCFVWCRIMSSSSAIFSRYLASLVSRREADADRRRRVPELCKIKKMIWYDIVSWVQMTFSSPIHISERLGLQFNKAYNFSVNGNTKDVMDGQASCN